jgi:large-conductance mechanosensitive channel
MKLSACGGSKTDRNVITRRDAVKYKKIVEMLVNHLLICVRIFVDLKINNSHPIQLWDMRKSAY